MASTKGPGEGRQGTCLSLSRAALHHITADRLLPPARSDCLPSPAEVGFEALHPLRYASERERPAPPGERSSYRGALHPFEVRDPESGELRRLRVAYVHSSEEAREVAAARERALRKAEEALARIERGLGGRHYKTKTQVDRRS
jgi:hypothetical protein